jgi:hypothetical protein
LKSHAIGGAAGAFALLLAGFEKRCGGCHALDRDKEGRNYTVVRPVPLSRSSILMR